jgi:DNA invertase Pin-like site-specific DNA recombinase
MRVARVAMYSRVSTTGQDAAMQVSEMRERCQALGWQAVEYADTISSRKKTRPGLERLMTDARKRKFDCVMVYKYDRFARSLKELVVALEEFKELGIDFISLHDGVDTTTSTGRLMFNIIASFAEFERDIIRQRVVSGVEQARREGKVFGRPIGTGSTKAGRIVPDGARIVAMRGVGMSWSAICKQTGLSKGTAQRAEQRQRASLPKSGEEIGAASPEVATAVL